MARSSLFLDFPSNTSSVDRNMRRVLERLSESFGSIISPDRNFRFQNPDVTDFEWKTWLSVKPFTMTHVESVIALIRATQYLIRSNIAGDMVECGVWRGGSAMTIASTLAAETDISRELYLYDTFQGMPFPTADDVDCDGNSASELLATTPRICGSRDIWAYASLQDVAENLARVPFERKRIRLVEGPVEDTIPATIPDRIALLRLDTDWYESTRHELQHLYPRLTKGGILIIDDYGYWQGARRATDEFFSKKLPYLHRVDSTARIVVKTED